MDGVTVNGDLSINYGAVTVEDGLTLNGTATIAEGANGLYFVGTQTLGGNGTVVFGNPVPYPYPGANYMYTDAAASTLTIGPSITVNGNVGVLGGYYSGSLYGSYPYGSYTTSGGSIINEGTIQADASAVTIALLGSGWQNPGQVLASPATGAIPGFQEIAHIDRYY